MTGHPTVHQVARVTLRGDGQGYLRAEHVTTGDFAAVAFPETTPAEDRRVVLDLGNVVGFAPGAVQRIAQHLLDARAGVVQVESTQKSAMRQTFAASLAEALAQGSGAR